MVSLPAPLRVISMEVLWAGAAIGAIALVGVLAVAAPTVAVGFGFLACIFGLAAGLYSRLGVSPMWAMMPVLFLQPWNGIRVAASVTVGDVALVLAALAAIPFVRGARVPGRLMLPLVGVILVTAGGLAGSVAAGGVVTPPLITPPPELAQILGTQLLGTSGNTSTAIRFVLGAPMVILIVCMLRPTPAQAARLGQAFALGTVISVLAAIAGFHYNAGFGRAVGFAAHFLHFGLTCLFSMSIGIGWMVSATTLRSRAVGGVITLLCVYGIVLSGARSALLGAVGVGLYFALLGRGDGLRKLFLAAAGAGVVGWFALPHLASTSAVSRLLGVGGSASVTISNAQHTQVLQSAVSEVAAHPLTGTGFVAGLGAHNLELESLNVGGLLGIIGLVLVWGTIFTTMWRQLKYGIRRDQWLRASMSSGLIGFFILAQFENIFWDRYLWLYISLALIAAPDPRPAVKPAEVESDEVVGYGLLRQ